MKVTVLGAGAIGSMLGGLLKQHAPEIEVRLIARGSHGDAMIRQRGVILRGSWGSAQVALPVSTDVRDLAGSDYVVLTVKSHGTEQAIRGVAEHAPGATVISIQNGINQPVLLRYVKPDRLVAGMTDTSISILEPGAVRMRRAGVIMIGPGEAEGPMDVARDAAALLQRSGHKIVTNPNMLGAQYNKLVFNCLGAAASLSDSEFLRECILYRPWREAVAIPLQQEALDVLAQANMRLSPLPGGSDAWRFRRLLRMLGLPVIGPLLTAVVDRLVRRQPIYFSLGADLKRGKGTEIDWINGEIVRLARCHQFPAPRHERVVQLVHELEQRGGFFTREEVIAIFREIDSGEVVT
jgi:2-dehydropantoate 2-reductase